MRYTNFYKFKIIQKESKFWGFAVILIVFIIWEILSRTEVVFQLYFPPASKILATFFQLITTGEFLSNILSSLYRMTIGYFIAAILAIGLGIIMGSWGLVYRLFEPLIEVLRPIPSVAIIPIAILFLGIGDPMKIFIIVYASIWPALINTIDGIRNVEPIQIDTGKVFGLSNAEIILKIKIPSASPYIVSGLRVSLAIALILTITSEMVGGINGLGYFILISQRSFRIPEMFAGVMAIAIIGYTLNRLFLYIESKLMRWQKGLTRQA